MLKKRSGKTLIFRMDQNEIRIALLNLSSSDPVPEFTTILETPEGAIEDGDIKRPDLLEEVIGMNFDYLNRTFRRVTGKTVFQYLNRVRINRVKELLKTTDMKLSEIAALTGFSDEFYLSRQFKKATGVSPVQYSRGQFTN